jgi:hypothetical protein
MYPYLKHYWDVEYIIDGFKKGFSLGLKERPSLKPCTKILATKPDVLTKITDEVQKGRIIGPFARPPIDNLMISPVCTIPKANSTKRRMIFNLSHPTGASVNDNLRDEARSVQYCSVSDVANG